MDAPQVRVYLTGGLRIETAGGVVDHRAFDFPHAQLVVAFLVCERSRPVAWTEILDILPPSAASTVDAGDLLTRLATTLAEHVPASELRRTTSTIELSLPRDTWVDIEAAAEAIHEAESALRTKRTPDAFGPSAIAHHIARRAFLPGEHGPWVEGHRERLRGILLRGLEARGEIFLWNNETALAVEAGREAVKLEPYRETGHQLLLRALAAGGNTAEALRAYEHCRQVLREGLGIEPSAQTRRVFESLAPQRTSASPATSPTPDLAATREVVTPNRDPRSVIERALGAEYAVERELAGGMSKVFVAQERALGRRVVIKVLPPAMADTSVAQRFAQEVLLAARLQHPNIVPVLSAGLIDGVFPYYTMPYVAGDSLRAAASEPSALTVPRIGSILWNVARALAFAHSEGVIHRDIKPENILLTGDAAVVTDFGIAKAVTDTGYATFAPGHQAITSAGISLGTPQYMAPEQILADPSLDHRADIYSLGVVAYELLAGCLPFRDFGLRQALAGPAEPPREVSLLRPDAPASLSRLVMQCLARNPDERPQSMTEVISQLEASGSGGPPVR